MLAIDRIREIEEQTKSQIDSLRKEAAAEIIKRITSLKEELKGLETQFAELTGRPLPTESVGGTPIVQKARKRLTSEEKTALVETVRGILASHPTGAKMSDIVSGAGESASAVREALLQIKLKTTGSKSTTRYFLK